MKRRAESRWIIKAVGIALFILPVLHGAQALGQPPIDLDIYDVQYTTDPSGDSPYWWQTVRVEGVVTARFWEGFVIADGSGAWNAIYVNAWTVAPSLGDRVVVAGLVYEHFDMTMIVEMSEFYVVDSGQTVPLTPIPVADVAQEAYESVLVSVQNVLVGGLLSHGEWAVGDTSGYALVNDLNDYVYFPKMWDSILSLTGVVFYSYGEFKIEPRFTADIVTPVLPHYALQGTVVTMNDSRDILADAYVEIDGDLIVGVHSSAPAGLDIYETGGLIFPGLVDAHNHAFWNVLDVIPFATTFEDRYEWRASDLYQEFKDQRRAILHYPDWYEQEPNIVKMSELRALAAGTTTMQGINCNGPYDPPFAHQGMVIDNAERHPALTYSVVDPLNVSPEDWAQALSENWERFAIHLAEGVNPASLAEFYALAGAGLLSPRITIIHGVPLGDPEWFQMGAAGANLVWSPMSNWQLYGDTADVPGALAAGVNVALAPDWTPSGSANVLAEMQFADAWDAIFWGDSISPQQLAEQVTRNAADALASHNRAGQVAAGFRANLMVIPGDAAAPYEALVGSHPGTVKLTVVDGRAMYGDPEFATLLGLLGAPEEIPICNTAKLFSTTVDSHSIFEADKPVGQIISELTEAWWAAEPKISDLLLLEDTTTPRMLLEGPICIPEQDKKKARTQLVVHAFDDCGEPTITIDEVIVRNGDGYVVNGTGIVEIEGNRVRVESNGNGWSVEIVATAIDSSGNFVTTTYEEDLLKCK